jgi:hypothetical protein
MPINTVRTKEFHCAQCLANGSRKVYLAAMAKIGNFALIAALLGVLAAAGWYAARAWISVDGPPMPVTGYVAMTLGVVFSVAVGCGLMALLFYSHRHGYDEISYRQPQRRDDDRD